MGSLFRNRFRNNSLRYAGRDYSRPGKYFVTICTAQKTEWFGSVINGKMHLSKIGHIASQVWYEIPVHFPFIGLDAFVVMPNHIHGIIVINRVSGKPYVGVLHATPLLDFGGQFERPTIVRIGARFKISINLLDFQYFKA